MSKAIALTIGMTGSFFPNGMSHDTSIRAKVIKIWSETCVNLELERALGIAHPTSVFVPPLGTSMENLPHGHFFLPDAFVGAAQADQSVEQAIVQAGADVAPRVTPADVESNIVREHYFNAADAVLFNPNAVAVVHREAPREAEPLAQLTFCILTLQNGFTVTGESACASVENYDPEIGRRIARENAVAKIWPLMGYVLRTKLANAPKPNAIDPECVFRYCPSDDDCKARGRCVNRH